MTIEYQCVSCSHEFASDAVEYTCPRCSTESAKSQTAHGFRKGILLVKQPVGAPGHLSARANPHAMLPLPITLSRSFPAGNTPLLKPANLNDRLDMKNLHMKNDSANPSGSLKDRASLLVAEQALVAGQDTVVLASTGNAGSAMACAGAAAGIRVILFVPESAPLAKLVQSLLYGACVVPVKGTYDDAYKLSIEYTCEFGGINRNTAYNPLTIEGKKTVSIEIYNQLGYRAPDVVYIPAGDGVIFSGVYKGFVDLAKAGYIEKIPSLVLVQAEGSNAIAQSLRKGLECVLNTVETIADSLSVASPAAGELALRAIAESGGHAVEVSDDEIRSGMKELGRDAGLFVEPSSAAAWAGLRKDLPDIDTTKTVVVLLTGTGFKDPKAAGELVSVPESCEPDLGRARDLLVERYGVSGVS